MLIVTTTHSVLLVRDDLSIKDVLHRGSGVYYGVAIDGTGIYVAARNQLIGNRPSWDTTILHFSPSLNLMRTHRLPYGAVGDVHQIESVDGDVVLTSTADDGIVWWNDRQGVVSRSHPCGVGSDAKHFNSIFVGESVYGLAHCHADSEIWSIGESPKMVAILGNRAHNAWKVDDEWFVCDSSNGTVISESSTILELGGWVRGIAVKRSGECFIGSSERTERGMRPMSNGTIFRANIQARTILDSSPIRGHGQIMDVRMLDCHDICRPRIAV